MRLVLSQIALPLQSCISLMSLKGLLKWRSRSLLNILVFCIGIHLELTIFNAEFGEVFETLHGFELIHIRAITIEQTLTLLITRLQVYITNDYIGISNSSCILLSFVKLPHDITFILIATYLEWGSLPESIFCRLLFWSWGTVIVRWCNFILECLRKARDRVLLRALLSLRVERVVFANHARGLLIVDRWTVHAAEGVALVWRNVSGLTENVLRKLSLLLISILDFCNSFVRGFWRAHERHLTFVGFDGCEAFWFLGTLRHCDLSDIANHMLVSLVSSLGFLWYIIRKISI